MRLAAHCRDSWAKRLRAPARMRPQHSDRFLMNYFPRPPEGGPPLLPYARRPPRAPASSVPLAAPQHSRPPRAGSGTQGTLCLEHGAPPCARCKSWGRAGLGHQPLLPGWPRRPRGTLGGLKLPRGPSPGRTGPPSARTRGPTGGGSGVVLLAGASPPSVAGPPGLGPPGGAPVCGPAQGAGHAPTPSFGPGLLQARKAPDT